MAAAAEDLRRPLLAEEGEERVAVPETTPPQWQFAQTAETQAAPSADDADSWLYDESVANQPGCSAAAATLNLCTTIIGSGIMALPHVFRMLGIIPASAALLTVAFLTHVSLNMLVRGTVLSNKTSFGELVAYTSGKAAMVTTRVSVILNNLGATVVFFILIAVAVSVGSPLLFIRGRFEERWFCVGLVVLFVHLPLCCLRSVDNLKFTSLLSVLMSAMLITVTLGVMGDRILNHSLEHVNWLPAADATFDDFINAIPMLTTAYVCHYNVHPIFSAMKNPSEGRMRAVLGSGLATTSIIYWLFAFSAYALFGDKTQGDVLMNYGTDLNVEHAKWVERAVKARATFTFRVHAASMKCGLNTAAAGEPASTGYALSLSCTIPLLMFPLKEHFFCLAGWGAPTDNLPRFYLTTVAILAIEFVLSIKVPNITVAFGIIGSTVAVLIGFVIPAWVAIGGKQPGAGGWALLIGGVIVGIVCFSSTVYGIFFRPENFLMSLAERSSLLMSFNGRHL